MKKLSLPCAFVGPMADFEAFLAPHLFSRRSPKRVGPDEGSSSIRSKFTTSFITLATEPEFKAHSHYLRFQLQTAVNICVYAEIENFLSLHRDRST